MSRPLFHRVCAATGIALACGLLAGCQAIDDLGSHFDFAGQDRHVTYLTHDASDHLSPTWSPDGARLAFVSNESGAYKLWLINRDGTGLRQLTTGNGDDRYPAWSPDGKRIAFASTRSGNWDIWALDVPVPADASEPALHQLTTNTLTDLAPAWSRDGQKIAFVSYRDLEYSIYIMQADGGDQRKLTTGGNGDWGPTWSMDGSAITFVSTRSGHGDLYRIQSDATPKGPYKRLTDTPERDMIPTLSPDGTKIAFVSERNKSRDIWVMNTDGTNPVRVTHQLSGRWAPKYDINHDFIEGIGYFYLAWSPDGASLAFTAVDKSGRGTIAIYSLS